MIKKMVLEIDDKEIELTLAQAKKLFKDLEQFMETRERIIERYVGTYPVQIPASPWRPAEPIWYSREAGTDRELHIKHLVAQITNKSQS
jgi:hypothetical protein